MMTTLAFNETTILNYYEHTIHVRKNLRNIYCLHDLISSCHSRNAVITSSRHLWQKSFWLFYWLFSWYLISSNYTEAATGLFYTKKVFLKVSQEFTEKHLCQRLFFNKVAGWGHGCFSLNFPKFLRTAFSHLRWLLLIKSMARAKQTSLIPTFTFRTTL